MPGKVNPTQAEMLTMVCTQVLGTDVAVSMAGTQGHLELNVFRPLVIHGVLQSCRLLAEGMDSFRRYCLVGLSPQRANIAKHLSQSLMLVTALTPKLGYERAAAIAHRAHHEGLTLREAALATGLLTSWINSTPRRPPAPWRPPPAPSSSRPGGRAGRIPAGGPSGGKRGEGGDRPRRREGGGGRGRGTCRGWGGGEGGRAGGEGGGGDQGGGERGGGGGPGGEAPAERSGTQRSGTQA